MYFSIWIALLVCTLLTYKAAFIELGRFNAAIAPASHSVILPA